MQQNVFSGKIIDDCMKGIILTIPKKKNNEMRVLRTLNFKIHASKIITRVIKNRIEKTIEANLGDDQFGFRRSIETMESALALKIMIKNRLDGTRRPLPLL